MSLEAERQRWLLATLAQGGAPTAGWLDARMPAAPGLAAYRRNAAATAERALQAAHPTLQQLLGPASFAALARTAWRCHPPTAGDLALWNGGLTTLIAESESLGGEPYLPDVAAVDWAVHRAGFAANAAAPTGLQRLADHDPQHLRLQLAAGTALIDSAYPVAGIWRAHRRSDGARFDAVRAALASGVGEAALVQRQGLRVQVLALDAATARFTAALLSERPLATALELAGDGFDFAAWLLPAVQQWQLISVRSTR